MPRYAFVTLFLIFMLTLISGCGGASKSIPLAEEVGSELRTYEVFGMDCPGCHGGLEKLIDKLPGVIESRANWEEKSLVIRLPKGSDLSDEEIFAAIRKANFTPGQRLN